MKKYLHPTKLCSWPVAMLSVALALPALTTPALAGEELPPNNALANDAEEVLERYIKEKSRPTLKRFDELVKERNPNKLAQNEWVAKSKEVLSALEESYKKAVEKQKQKRNLPPLPPVKKWYEQEVQNWKNIQSVGKDLVGVHDDLVYYTHLLETEKIKELSDKKDEAEKMAGQITFWMTQCVDLMNTLNVPLPSLGLINDVLKAFGSFNDKINPVAASLEKLLVRQEADIKKLAKEVAGKKFKDNLSRLESQKIDADQSGIYYQHERVWESDVKDQVSKFEGSYNQYKMVATPFLQYWIERDLKKGSSKIAQWFKWKKGDSYEKLDESADDFIEDLTDEVEEIKERVEADLEK